VPSEYYRVDGFLAQPEPYKVEPKKQCAICINWQPTYKNTSKISKLGLCLAIEIYHEYYNMIDRSKPAILFKTPHDWNCGNYEERFDPVTEPAKNLAGLAPG